MILAIWLIDLPWASQYKTSRIVWGLKKFVLGSLVPPIWFFQKWSIIAFTTSRSRLILIKIGLPLTFLIKLVLIENYFYTVFLIINTKLKKLIFFSLKTEK